MNEQGPLPAEGTRGRQVRDRDRVFMRWMTRAQLRVMRATGGRLLARMGGHPVLALTTTGWRSGHEFSTPVIGIGDGDDWPWCASSRESRERTRPGHNGPMRALPVSPSLRHL